MSHLFLQSAFESVPLHHHINLFTESKLVLKVQYILSWVFFGGDRVLVLALSSLTKEQNKQCSSDSNSLHCKWGWNLLCNYHATILGLWFSVFHISVTTFCNSRIPHHLVVFPVAWHDQQLQIAWFHFLLCTFFVNCCDEQVAFYLSCKSFDQSLLFPFVHVFLTRYS